MDQIFKYAIGNHPVVKQINQGFNEICEKFEGKKEPETTSPDQPNTAVVDEETIKAREKLKKEKEKLALERTTKRAQFRNDIREKYKLKQDQRDSDLVEGKYDENNFTQSFRTNSDTPKTTVMPPPQSNKTSIKYKVAKLFKL